MKGATMSGNTKNTLSIGEKKHVEEQVCKYFMQCGARRKRGMCACKDCPTNPNKQ